MINKWLPCLTLLDPLSGLLKMDNPSNVGLKAESRSLQLYFTAEEWRSRDACGARQKVLLSGA